MQAIDYCCASCAPHNKAHPLPPDDAFDNAFIVRILLHPADLSAIATFGFLFLR